MSRARSVVLGLLLAAGLLTACGGGPALPVPTPAPDTAGPPALATPALSPSPTGAPTATPTPAPGGAAGATPTWPAAALAAIAAAKQDWAGHAAVDAATIAVQSVKPTMWPDPSLGCPQAGHAYIQVLTPGYVIVLAAGAAQTTYHADAAGRVVTCAATP